MSLPKIKLPLFEITIPSSGKKTTFRPMTLKEEKILLIAQEGKDLDQTILSIKQVLQNCVDDIDPDELASFDVEYLLIKIRSKSMNNMFEFSFLDPDTKEKIEVSLDIDQIQIHKPENHNKNVQISEEMIALMKYPSIDDFKLITKVATNTENKSEAQQQMLGVMLKCIDTLIVGDALYKLENFTKQEIEDFIDSMTQENIQYIQQFFETMPVLKYEFKYKNSDGKDKTFTIQGIDSFFT